MSEPTACASGRAFWVGDLKQTRKGEPMRRVMVSTGNDSPSVAALLFGDIAESVQHDDSIAVEGPVDASAYKKDGETKVTISIMARWSRQIGHAGARRSKEQRQQNRAVGARQQPQNGHDAAVTAQGPLTHRSDQISAVAAGFGRIFRATGQAY